MPKAIITCIVCLLLAGTAAAQGDSDSVKATVNRLFEAMKKADAATMQEVFADSALLQTITTSKDGQLVVRNQPIKDFIAFVGRQTPGTADEQIRFQSVHIDGPLAAVWTPYSFYHNGQFSHCGVNSFQLVRTGNGWKIQYIIDTRRKENCQ